MTDDSELLRRYVESRSEEAFSTFVERHVNLVYFAALRRVGGNPTAAEDVTQYVFTTVARQAASLMRHATLTGWLYTTTRNAATKVVRSNRIRQRHEQHIQFMYANAMEPTIEWEQLRPVIDETLEALNAREREAVLLRFFEGRAFAEIGAVLKISDDAARMRVERALDKMEQVLGRRGVKSAAAALGLALANQVGVAAPAGLAASVTRVAIHAVATGGVATTAAVWTFMSATKLQIGVASALALFGIINIAVYSNNNAELRTELATLREQNQEFAALQAENQRLVRTAAEVQRYRADDAALARLRDETAMLQRRMQTANTPQVETPWPNGHPIYNAEDLDEPPVAILQKPPSYPFELRRTRSNGRAVIDVVIDHHGSVQDAVVLNATHVAAGEVALNAVKQWKYEAGRKQGSPANARLQVPVEFTISDNSSGAPRAWF